MVFLKPLDELKFADVEQLKSNRICESDVLDYKEQLLKDDEFLKHVSAFANTQGGFLIFGVKETGKGGYPENIVGIEKSEVNKERLEQVILGNIQPRLNVKIQTVDLENQSKTMLIVQIPNSYLKPHMMRQGERFYKRYNFEALPMTEVEVSDAYMRRFAGSQEVENYISKTMKAQKITSPQILGQIVVIPTTPRRMIDTSDQKRFDWIAQISLRPNHRYSPSTYWRPSPDGVISQYEGAAQKVRESLEIHRNGCVCYEDDFGISNDTILLDSLGLCIRLMHTLQFASAIYQRYNYFGDVRIVCSLQQVKGSEISKREWSPRSGLFQCQVDEIKIVREFPTTIVESKYEYITSGMMDDIFNSYGLWECPFFDENANFVEPK